jgi:hypothetical protein
MQAAMANVNLRCTDIYRFFCGIVAHQNALHIPCDSGRLTEENEQRKYASVQWVVV